MDANPPANAPIKGAVYTVSEVRFVEKFDDTYLGLEELDNGDGVFLGTLFRPVTKTNIDVFIEIAKNPKMKIEGPPDKVRIDA